MSNSYFATAEQSISLPQPSVSLSKPITPPTEDDLVNALLTRRERQDEKLKKCCQTALQTTKYLTDWEELQLTQSVKIPKSAEKEEEEQKIAQDRLAKVVMKLKQGKAKRVREINWKERADTLRQDQERWEEEVVQPAKRRKIAREQKVKQHNHQTWASYGVIKAQTEALEMKISELLRHPNMDNRIPVHFLSDIAKLIRNGYIN